jgi:post-segregation antitoxin (ccd killing protein)
MLVGCIYRRMPRMQVYLPDDLYKKLKSHGLPASELLQKAVRAELHRQELLAATDQYVASLVAQVGKPTKAERERARALAGRIARRSIRKAG